MLLRSVTITVLAFAFSAAAQDPPQTPKPEEKKEPSLDIDRWLRRELDSKQRNRNFFITPELKVAPEKVTPEIRAERTDGKCSVPLTDVTPQSNARARTLPVPKGEFHMRFIKPPAPPCNQPERRESDPPP